MILGIGRAFGLFFEFLFGSVFFSACFFAYYFNVIFYKYKFEKIYFLKSLAVYCYVLLLFSMVFNTGIFTSFSDGFVGVFGIGFYLFFLLCMLGLLVCYIVGFSEVFKKLMSYYLSKKNQPNKQDTIDKPKDEPQEIKHTKFTPTQENIILNTNATLQNEFVSSVTPQVQITGSVKGEDTYKVEDVKPMSFRSYNNDEFDTPSYQRMQTLSLDNESVISKLTQEKQQLEQELVLMKQKLDLILQNINGQSDTLNDIKTQQNQTIIKNEEIAIAGEKASSDIVQNDITSNQPKILKEEVVKEYISKEETSKPSAKKSLLTNEVAENKALLDSLEKGETAKPKDFVLPSLEFLQKGKNDKHINEEEIDYKIKLLLEKLGNFNIQGDVVRTYSGPVVSTFEFKPAPHIKVSKILNLSDDLAMALSAPTIRIQAPIPGKDVVGIEIPNESISTIYLRDVLESEIFKNSKSELTMALGKDIVGDAFVTDLKKLPHLLIAGTTGSGKSVGINSMVLSLLYKNSPKTLRLLMIDPKMLEFSIYNDIPHLLAPVITKSQKAINALKRMVEEMEHRYEMMANERTKNIQSYNEKMQSLGKEILPYIVIIIDELADLMMTSGKDCEVYIARLAQMARAAGIHLIVATQRPSVDVITGLIKANLPSRLSYRVGQKTDSRVILESSGAESLLGRGDSLFTPPTGGALVRLHAPFASEEEIINIVEFLKSQGSAVYDERFFGDENSELSANLGEQDELLEAAKEVMLNDKVTSISNLQRRLKIGYNRAATIVEQLEACGFLTPPNTKGIRDFA